MGVVGTDPLVQSSKLEEVTHCVKRVILLPQCHTVQHMCEQGGRDALGLSGRRYSCPAFRGLEGCTKRTRERAKEIAGGTAMGLSHQLGLECGVA